MYNLNVQNFIFIHIIFSPKQSKTSDNHSSETYIRIIIIIPTKLHTSNVKQINMVYIFVYMCKTNSHLIQFDWLDIIRTYSEHIDTQFHI